MKTYIFFYREVDGKPYQLTGSDSIMLMDGRRSLSTIIFDIKNRAKQIGPHVKYYSIGVLTVHDPEDKHAQRYKQITKL